MRVGFLFVPRVPMVVRFVFFGAMVVVVVMRVFGPGVFVGMAVLVLVGVGVLVLVLVGVNLVAVGVPVAVVMAMLVVMGCARGCACRPWGLLCSVTIDMAFDAEGRGQPL